MQMCAYCVTSVNFDRLTDVRRFYAQYVSYKPNTAMMEKSQLKYNYLLQPGDDVRATNETLAQSTVNGNVFRGAGYSNDVIIQRA